MPSNSEMYDRGALDAEQDELNSFYYQHYYYYRRGYDDSRRQQRGGGRRSYSRLLVALALAAVALFGGLWLFRENGAPQAVPTVAVGPTAALAVAPTRTPTPTRAPTAVPTPAQALAIGARARIVNLNGSPLRARETPGLSAVVGRIPEGSEVTLRDGPAEAEGYRWWRVEAEGVTGWVAEGSPEGVVFLEPVP